MAHGSIALVCTGRISMVPALAAAVPAVGFDASGYRLDGQHYPDLLCLAFAHAWPSVDSSGLDHGAGIRACGCGRCLCRFCPQTAGGDPTLA